MDKLTKRQRMAYLQKQNPNNEKNRQTQVQIGRLNKEDQAAVLAKYLDPNVDTDMVFYELGSKAKTSRKFDEGEFEFDDDEELLEGLQRSRANRKPKSQVNQAQQDEQKRLQLEKILQEQHQRFKDREKKLQNHMHSEVSGGNGAVGRFVFQNQQRLQSKQVVSRPKQDKTQVLKLVYKGTGARLMVPKPLVAQVYASISQSPIVCVKRTKVA